MIAREVSSGRRKVWASKMDAVRERTVLEALQWLRWEERVSDSTRITIKPNMTYPFYKPGVTTNPELLEAVVKVLSSRTRNITIVESDGGSYAWSADVAFKGHRIPEMCERHGARAVNLTHYPRETARARVGNSEVEVELSRLLLRETDLFITMPVPKIHAMTTVSLGFKNQWGCMPDVKRLRNHPEFARKVLAINKLLPAGFAIFDGTYFLNRNGPMEGEAVRMDLLVASDDIGAGTLACCELMGIKASSVAHLRLAMAEGMMPRSIADVALNGSLAALKGPKFYLERSWLQLLTLGVFKSNLATRLLYDSWLAKPAHDVLYLVRGRPRDFAPKW